jgi:hypothetical protein
MPENGTRTEAPQRLRALEQANAIRLARAELKRRVAEGQTSAAEVIMQCPDEARRWTLGELLMSQRRWGTSRCRKFLEGNHLTEVKAIGALTERQRRVLAEQLSGRRTDQGFDGFDLADERQAAAGRMLICAY